MAKKMRTVQATVRAHGWTYTFDLACHPSTRFEEGQPFEIPTPRGYPPLEGRILRNGVVNRSNGTTSFIMIVDDAPRVVQMILENIPEVSNLKYK